MSEEQIFTNTLRAFRSRRIEPVWEELNLPERERYLELFAGLAEVGATALALDEAQGGLELGTAARLELFVELGAGSPALGCGLLAHHTALSLLREALAGAAWPAALDDAASQRFALIGSPLDARPQADFELRSNGALHLFGEARVAWPQPDWLVLRARDGQHDRLVVVSASAEGLRFDGRTSSHGLRLLPFGQLQCNELTVDPALVFDWPSSGRSAREADGLLCGLLAGMLREMHQRAMAYALVRYQGGKMIHEHDAVQNLVSPMLVAEPALLALAAATLEDTSRPGDGSASAFAIEQLRSAGLDAVQTFGGYGYMEDYRVERYLRDANTLETCWIHAAQRRRSVAVQRFRDLSQ